MDTTVVWTLLAVLVAIAIAAPRYGVDSRWLPPGEPPPPPRRRPTVRGDLAALRTRGASDVPLPLAAGRRAGRQAFEQVGPSR